MLQISQNHSWIINLNFFLNYKFSVGAANIQIEFRLNFSPREVRGSNPGGGPFSQYSENFKNSIPWITFATGKVTAKWDLQGWRPEDEESDSGLKNTFYFPTWNSNFRTHERTNERTNARTHTQPCHCDALVLVFGLWGGLGFGSARETVRPVGLLHTHTFLFHQDKHETCKRSLTHHSGSRGVPTHSHTLTHAYTQYIPSPAP